MLAVLLLGQFMCLVDAVRLRAVLSAGTVAGLVLGGVVVTANLWPPAAGTRC